MKCPFCAQDIEDGSTVCSICGKELTAGSASEEAAAPTETETEKVTDTAAEAADTVETVTEAADTAAESQPEEPKKNNKMKYGIAAVAAVAVIAVGAAVLMPKTSPKDTVIDAFKSITAKGQTDPMEEIFGWDAMNEKLSKESSEMNLELQLQESSDETVNQLATGKIGMSAMNDVEGKKSSFVLGVGYADMNLANLEVYLDDKQVVAAIPELTKKAFSLNYADDLEGQLENSPYVGELLSESGTDLTGLNSYITKAREMASSETQLFDVKALWNRYKEGSKAIDDLKAAMTVEKTDKKDFTINGSSQSCKGYNVTITKDALIQFANTSKEFFLSDETLKKDFIEYMSLMTELQGTMAAMTGSEDMTPEQAQEEMWKDTEEQADDLIAQLDESLGDVTMVVYVAKDGKMASFDYNTTVTEDEVVTKVYGTAAFAGGYNMLANVNATVNMEDASGQVVTLTLDKTGTYEAGKTYTGALTAAFTDGTDTYSLAYNGDYAVETGDYNLSLDFLNNGTSAGTITSKGLVQNLVKGESFEAYVESIKLESAAFTGTDEYIDLSGFYRAGPLDGTIEIPEGENMDVLAATEEDYTAVMNEIIGNVYGLMMSVYQ